MMTLNEILYQIADELRGVASIGLRFSDNGYDHERYERILRLSSRLVGAMEDRPEEEIFQKYSENFSHVSPLMAVEAAVFRDGKLLLIRRSDTGLWAVPGGLSEIGETISQAVLRELWEEAGIHGTVQKVMAIFDSRLWKMTTKMQIIAILLLVESDETPQLHTVDDKTTASFSETLDVGFFSEDQLPALSPGHDTRVPFIFKLYRGEATIPYLD